MAFDSPLLFGNNAQIPEFYETGTNFSLVSILTFFFFFAKIYNTKLVLEESFG